MLHTAVVLLKKDGKVLLGFKKRGFGIGKLTSIGGKQEKDETIEEAAIRETFEEIGIKVTKMEHMADVVFDNLHYNGEPERDMMHVFVATEWKGEPQESDEIKPEWVKISDLPYEKMWGDNKHWLPEVLRGKKIEAWFHYNKKNEFTDFWVKKLPTECISRITDETVGLENTGEDPANFIIKEGARAVLVNKKGQVALIHSINRGWYKLPGGGREKDELIYENLEREVLEETGYKIKDVKPLGIGINIRSQWQMIGKAYLYTCHADKFVKKEQMPDEIEDGDTLEWFNSFDEAIAALEAVKLDEIGFYGAYFFTRREIDTLKYARQEFERERHA